MSDGKECSRHASLFVCLVRVHVDHCRFSESQRKSENIARPLANVVGKAHARQMDKDTRSNWPKELSRARTGDLKAPSWLWSSVVDLLAIHEKTYLEHCRVYALNEIPSLSQTLAYSRVSGDSPKKRAEATCLRRIQTRPTLPARTISDCSTTIMPPSGPAEWSWPNSPPFPQRLPLSPEHQVMRQAVSSLIERRRVLISSLHQIGGMLPV
jgi:hypothetical protein